MSSKQRNTEEKETIKKEDKKRKIAETQATLKSLEPTNEILEQKAKVKTQGSLESTYTKMKLRNGTVKETYGERYGRPADGS